MKEILENWRRKLHEESKESKKLFIFDFDDTLVSTDGQIVHKDSGKRFDSSEWEEFKSKNPDVSEKDFDFSEFQMVVNPKPIKNILNLMISKVKSLSPSDKVVILTARGAWEPIKAYLNDQFSVDIKIVAVNSPDYSYLDGTGPDRKASWVKNQLSKGFHDIFFWDDSIDNIYAVKSIEKAHPGVSVTAHLVSDGEETTFKELKEIEKFQKLVKNKHSRMKKRLIKHGNQPNTPPYTVKPSLKRSKSAPPGGV
jgi:hypothetical protein